MQSIDHNNKVKFFLHFEVISKLVFLNIYFSGSFFWLVRQSNYIENQSIKEQLLS